MKNKILLPVIMAVDGLVFLTAAATVAILAYEGLTLTPYPGALDIPVMLMDLTFLISVFLHLLHRDKNRLFLYGNLFNLALIIAAYALMFAGLDYPPWTLLFWDMYLMLFYFARMILLKNETDNKDGR